MIKCAIRKAVDDCFRYKIHILMYMAQEYLHLYVHAYIGNVNKHTHTCITCSAVSRWHSKAHSYTENLQAACYWFHGFSPIVLVHVA
jgi:hypothetical protein